MGQCILLYLQQLGGTDPTSLKFWVGMTTAGSSLPMALFAPIWGKESRELLVLILSAGFVHAANQVSTPTLPLFVQSMETVGTLVASTTGTILGAAAFAAAAAALIGRVSYRIGYRRTLLLSLLGAGCFSLPQAFAATPVILLVFRILGGVCIGGTMSSINAMITVRTELNRRGSVFGISSAFVYGGAALGPA